MIAENIYRQATRRLAIFAILLLCALAVMAEDVTFMTNRRQWEKLPTATLMHMGNDFMNIKNMPDSGMLCYSLIANRYNENLNREELEQCIRATCNVGRIYSENYHNQQQAYHYFLLTQELVDRHQYTEFIPDVLMYIGNLYWTQHGLKPDKHFEDEAMSCHRAAFQQALKTKSYQTLTPIFLNMTYVAFCNDRLLQIKDEINAYDALTLKDSTLADPLAQTVSRACQFIFDNRPERAIELFKSVSIDKSKLPSKARIQIMLNEFVYLLELKSGHDDEALNTALINLELMHQYEPELINGAYLHLVDYYRNHNNLTLAEKYELLWWRSTDSIAHASHADDINTVRFLHEIDKMNAEVKELNYKEQTKERILWIVGAFSLIAIALLVLLYISRRRIQEGYQRLYRQNVELLAADEARRQAEAAQPEAMSEVPKYSHNQMDDDVMDELWLQIKRVMETSEDIYHDPFGVDQLADLLGAKRNYVSQTINTKTSEPFPTLLTEYRIREACRRMNDQEHYGNYSVEGIAQSVGYGSRSHFAKLFKAATGVPPSAYMKMCKAGTPPDMITHS